MSCGVECHPRRVGRIFPTRKVNSTLLAPWELQSSNLLTPTRASGRRCFHRFELCRRKWNFAARPCGTVFKSRPDIPCAAPRYIEAGHNRSVNLRKAHMRPILLLAPQPGFPSRWSNAPTEPFVVNFHHVLLIRRIGGTQGRRQEWKWGTARFFRRMTQDIGVNY